MSGVKAIETVYNGHKFRSRLEARWGVFFDNFGLHYEYEPEGFEGDGWRYLPDFYLPSLQCYVEIKPYGVSTSDVAKLLNFAVQGKKNLLVILGTPSECGRDGMFGANGNLADASFHSFLLIGSRLELAWDEWHAREVQFMQEDKDAGIVSDVDDGQLAVNCLLDNGSDVYFAECLTTGDPILVKKYASDIGRRMSKAGLTAKQARFEFGQTPAKPRGT